MYQKGHVGVSMLVYLPILTASVVLAPKSFGVVATGWAVVVMLASLPDIDMRISFVKHRGFTHTVWFAGLVGAAFGAIGYFSGIHGLYPVSTQGEFAAFLAFAGGFSVIAHLLGDVLTPTGVKPFSPLWNRKFTVNVTKAKNPASNLLLFGAGVVLTLGVVGAFHQSVLTGVEAFF